jgi:glucose-1-phosphate cytidylyltransferase
MKVVLFCGGLGTRLRDYDESIPKPMVTIGYRPIMWNLMRYYAHHGHKHFILCLGHKADVIKQYFVDYDEKLSNDFVLTDGGRKARLLSSDIEDWEITFADTGLTTSIGERLRMVRPHLAGEETFLANYSDCLTDLDLADLIRVFKKSGKIAGFVTVAPSTSYHYVEVVNGVVSRLVDARTSSLRVNGGFFIFRQEIFDYIQPGDELVDAPFRRLIEKQQLMTYEYNGFWKAMDTFKDKQQLDEMLRKGNPPWEVWRPARRTNG